MNSHLLPSLDLRGAVVMLELQPHAAGSQFVICVVACPEFDGPDDHLPVAARLLLGRSGNRLRWRMTRTV